VGLAINKNCGALRDSQATWKRVKGNQDTDFLSSQESQYIVDMLLFSVTTTHHERWCSLRDHVLVATFLGAGLKVS
jgi:hypothetical protein